MEQDALVRADIQKYEETLAKDPGSYCFAPLAELYRKLGLLDEAINVAQRGCQLHPDYVGGYMALGRACVEKGLKDEGRTALEKVVGIAPDNLLAARLLSHIYIDQGNSSAAEGMLRHILSQNPGDSESQVLLDSIETTLGWEEKIGGEFAASKVAESSGEDEIILEDADVVEDLEDEDFLEDDFIISPPADGTLRGADSFIEGKSPLATATMAELYVSQGFEKRALTIYRELLDADPENAALKNRLYELKAAIDEDTASARYSSITGTEADDHVPAAEAPGDAETLADLPVSVAPEGVVVETLEKWLDSIKRRR